MKSKKVYLFSNNWLWLLFEENGQDYFYRFDKIPKFYRLEQEKRKEEAKTIAELKQLNIKTIKTLIHGFYLAQELKKQKWTELIIQNYYLDPTIPKHTVSH